MSYLFVYGTLRRDASNHAVLLAFPEIRFVCGALTEPMWTLRDMGPYPALCPEGKSRVRGELYAIPERHLDAVDEFEGSEYRRVSIQVTAEIEARIEEAFAYVWIGPCLGPAILSGDWMSRSEY